MKPARFEYYNPATLSEALALLVQLGDGVKVLAGGQSLVPMMNFRLVRPSHLVDLNRVGELSYLRVQSGELRIGAMTRQRELERSAVVAEQWPLLREAAGYIAHVQIRNRGTVGGSLAHAYPSAELPVVMAALEAKFVLRSQQGERTLGAGDFFVTHMTTALEPNELLVEVRVPPVPPRTGWDFQEVSRRYGDFAMVGVAGLVTLDRGGSIQETRLVFTGPAPVRSAKAGEFSVGRRPEGALFREMAAMATEGLDQDSDIHASAEYRREVAAVLAQRVLERAAGRALRRGTS
jgi:CO/xanthine dehydrogenase FAD-binding subunit